MTEARVIDCGARCEVTVEFNRTPDGKAIMRDYYDETIVGFEGVAEGLALALETDVTYESATSPRRSSAKQTHLLFIESTRVELIAVCSSPEAARKILEWRHAAEADNDVLFDDWCRAVRPMLRTVKLNREFYVEVHEMASVEDTEDTELRLVEGSWK